MRILRNKKNQGFSFIEVLTVIIILSILVGAGLPAYLWTRADTRERKKAVAIQRVEEAKLKYYNAVKSAAAENEIPDPADLAPYLIVNPGSGGTSTIATTNAFYSNSPECIFDRCFPPNEIWYLNPNRRSEKPFYEQIGTNP
jgi:prepilin-type N-terminal cleavage/methylation domain-containing protein